MIEGVDAADSSAAAPRSTGAGAPAAMGTESKKNPGQGAASPAGDTPRAKVLKIEEISDTLALQ